MVSRMIDAAEGLQWGHVFSDVEMSYDLCRSWWQRNRCFNGATSFQTWKFQTIRSRARPPERFNGATSFQTWKFGLGTYPYLWVMPASMGPRLFRRGNFFHRGFSESWYRCFNGATSFQTWKLGDVIMIHPITSSFNGATSFQTWKCIRPRTHRTDSICFNGATSFQTWKWTMGALAQREDTSFNGATSFQTWK